METLAIVLILVAAILVYEPEGKETHGVCILAKCNIVVVHGEEDEPEE